MSSLESAAEEGNSSQHKYIRSIIGKSNSDDLDPYYEDVIQLFVDAKGKEPSDFIAT